MQPAFEATLRYADLKAPVVAGAAHYHVHCCTTGEILTSVRFLWNRHLSPDLKDEVGSHIQVKAEELEADGLSREEAFREARRGFGNVTLITENTRNPHVFTFIETAIQDLRYGFRRLRREPAFTLAAVLTLGLVIGVNAAIFSMLEAVVLRPLPFPEPYRLIEIFGTNKDSNRAEISVPDLDDLATARSLSGIAAEQVQSVNYTGVKEPGRLIGGFVSASYFHLLGTQPAFGRGITTADENPGGPSVCLLNYAVWRDNFGSDPSILGRTLILNNEPHTIVGILSEGFRPRYINAEVWMPVRHYPGYSRDRSHTPVSAVARLAPGVTVEQARVELSAIMRRLAQEYPGTNRDRGVAVHLLQDIVIGPKRDPLLVLAVSVTCVLLLGCANIAGLLLTKAAGREQEIAIRASLGAKTGRIMRQLLTESMLLAMSGGIVGIILADLGMQLLQAYSPDLIGPVELHLNMRVIVYLGGISLLTGILFGLAPALAARRQNVTWLRQRGRGTRKRGLQSVLVVSQVALALVLLTAAGLMTISVRNVAAIDPGFKGDNVLTMEYRLPRDKYDTGTRETVVHRQIVARIAAIPGVESAALIGALPFSGNSNHTTVALPNRPEPVHVEYNPVSPAYFQTAGVPLLEGRDFSFADGAKSQPVAIINRSFANRFWPGQSVLGRQVRMSLGTPTDLPVTIVGVVGDVKQHALDDVGTPQLYRPYAQDPYAFATLTVRTKGAPNAMIKTVKQALWSVDPDQPLWKVRTLQSLVDRSYSDLRYIAWFLDCFALLALVLAAIGLYGLLACAVNQRTAELGIRMAVGAAPSDILRLVIGNGLSLTAAGIATGVVAALVLTRFLQTQVYGVTTADPRIYSAVALILFAVALVAVWLPARRAMRVDPVIALRQE